MLDSMTRSSRRAGLRRRTLSDWAVAGLLVPVLGGASVLGPAHAHPVHVSRAAQGAPASVTSISLDTADAAQVPRSIARPAVATAGATSVPELLWQAYGAAANGSPSGCHMPVTLLAAIGQVESGSLSGRALDSDHRVVPAVLGPVLDGHGFAAIADTDEGVLDGDARWDRAVGPMQFIPSTWARWGHDADGDGRADPQDIEDATAAAAAYLCADGRDLATDEGLRAAILSYNHSSAYLALVLRWKHAFDAVPPSTGPLDVVAPAPSRPPRPAPLPAPPAVPVAVVVTPAPQVVVEPPPTASAVPQTSPSTLPVEPAPSSTPTDCPAPQPSNGPGPTPDPSATPAADPAADPTADPTADPGADPSSSPTADPSPTALPTPAPTDPAPSPESCVTSDGPPPTPAP